MHLKNASILFTGAGSGIRPALALRPAENTPRLTLVGRRQQPLDELADHVRQPGGQAHGRTPDLTEPGAPPTVAVSARAGFDGIYVPVNNPGTVRAGRLEATDEPEGHGSGPGQPDGTYPAHPRGAAQPAGVRPRPGQQRLLGDRADRDAVLRDRTGHQGRYRIPLRPALRREWHDEGGRVRTVYPDATSTR